MIVVLSRAPDATAPDVELTLPSPPDFKASFSGSALPFPTERIAFDPAQPTVRARADGRVVRARADWVAPNWYYREGRLSPPRARASYVSGGARVVEMVDVRGAPRYPGRTLAPVAVEHSSTRRAPVADQHRLLWDRRATWPALRR